MDLRYTPAQQAFRAEVRDWLRANVPQEPFASYDTREGFEQHRQWEAKLASVGFSSLTWPKELGGRGSDLTEWLIFEEEYWAIDAPQRVNQNGILLFGPTMMEFGTPEQKARFLPRAARCEDMWAQGWSEPNAGSDMAAISSKATRDGDHYIVTGQKTWSTRAIFANWLFGLFRSDPNSYRHHGLTYLLVPLDAPGITIRDRLRVLLGDLAVQRPTEVVGEAANGLEALADRGERAVTLRRGDQRHAYAHGQGDRSRRGSRALPRARVRRSRLGARRRARRPASVRHARPDPVHLHGRRGLGPELLRLAAPRARAHPDHGLHADAGRARR